MTAYYLRMEAVNLSGFVEDCQDLSAIRGGSLLLLDSTKLLHTALVGAHPAAGFRVITSGASSAILAFEAEDGEDVRKGAEDWLNAQQALRHATFVVDVVPCTEDFGVACETLLARNRWRQMRSPSVAVPQRAGIEPCYKDAVRPGVIPWNDPEPPHRQYLISESVAARREEGRRKAEFYRIHTGFPEQFVEDLGRLATYSDNKSVDRKIAVIYADGNGFGKLQTRLCKNPATQTEFDTFLKRRRDGFLTELLRQARGNCARWRNEDKLRIETLLWGGDEFTLVVPARLGWETLQLFYSLSADWDFHDAQLTHAAAIVFCHHKAPIHRINRLCHSLVDSVKKNVARPLEQNGWQYPREADMFTYQTLESFDDIGDDPDSYRQRLWPALEAPREFVLPAAEMEPASQMFAALKRGFPRRKLFEIVRRTLKRDANPGRVITEVVPDLNQETANRLAAEIVRRTLTRDANPGKVITDMVPDLNQETANRLAAEIVRRTLTPYPDPGKFINAVVADLDQDTTNALAASWPLLAPNQSPVCWMHLAELWDYVSE